MKRVVAGLVMVMLLPLAAAFADDVKLGVLLGYTGPIESLVGPMADGAELAIKEVSDSGALLGGLQVVSVRGDTTCIDAAAATAAAERLITADRVNAIVGGDCSGVTIAVLQNVAKPNGIVMISPSATSPRSLPSKTMAFSSARRRRTPARVRWWPTSCRKWTSAKPR